MQSTIFRSDQTPMPITRLSIALELGYLGFGLGALFCTALLLTSGGSLMVLFYLLWALFAMRSVRAMLDRQTWGAYALMGSTLVLTLVDMLRGATSLPGAMVGLAIFVMIVIYLQDCCNEDISVF